MIIYMYQTSIITALGMLQSWTNPPKQWLLFVIFLLAMMLLYYEFLVDPWDIFIYVVQGGYPRAWKFASCLINSSVVWEQTNIPVQLQRRLQRCKIKGKPTVPCFLGCTAWITFCPFCFWSSSVVHFVSTISQGVKFIKVSTSNMQSSVRFL